MTPREHAQWLGFIVAMAHRMLRAEMVRHNYAVPTVEGWQHWYYDALVATDPHRTMEN